MSKESRQAVRAVFLAAIMVISVFAGGIAFSGSAAADGHIITVDQSGDGDYTSIDSALSNADPDDRIEIENGTYSNSAGITIGTEGVTLTAADGADPTIEVAPSSVSGTAAVDIQATGVTVSNLTIERIAADGRASDAGHAQGIIVSRSGATIKDNDVVGDLSGSDSDTFDRFDGITVIDPDDGSTTDNIDISDNDISGFDTGVVVTTFYGGDVSDVTVSNTDTTNNRIGFVAKTHDGSISGISGSNNDFTGNDGESIVFSPDSYQNYESLNSIPTTAVSFDGPISVEDGDSVQTAINVAADGATISVGPGTYNESAAIPDDPGDNEVGLYVGTPDLTIQGVDSSGNPITDREDVQAHIISEEGTSWGTNGVYVDAPGTTFTGLEFSPDPDSDPNKNFEVVDDDFTLRHAIVNDGNPDGPSGSVYFTSGEVQSFEVTDSDLEGYLSVNNGAGNETDESNRVIADNEIGILQFTGEQEDIPWRDYNAGSAEVNGNEITEEVFAQGDTDINLTKVAANNDFPNGKATARTPEGMIRSVDLTVTIDDPSEVGWTDKSEVNLADRRGIYSEITPAVEDAQPGDSVEIAAATYNESVDIRTENITLVGPNADIPGDASRGDEAIIEQGVKINASEVTVDGLQIETNGTNAVRIGPEVVPEDVTIQNNIITDVGGGDFLRNKQPAGAGNGIQVQFARGEPEGETAENLRILNNKISNVTTLETTGRTTAVGINILPRGNDVELNITGNTITDIEAGNSLDDTERSRAISVDTQFDGAIRNGEVSDPDNFAGRATELVITNNEITDITSGDRVRAVALFEDGRVGANEDAPDFKYKDGITQREGPEDFVITGNEFDDISAPGEFESAVFIGGYNDLGDDHAVARNNIEDGALYRFAAPQDGFSVEDSDDLNAVLNWWGENATPRASDDILYDPVLTVPTEDAADNTTDVRNYGSYIEVETEGEPTVIGFPAPPAEPLSELLSNDTLERDEGEGVTFFIYDNANDSFEIITDLDSTTPQAGEVLVITTENQSTISEEIIVPVETDTEDPIGAPTEGEVQLDTGWNLVATGAANSADDPIVAGTEVLAGTQLGVTQPSQPGAPDADVGAYHGTWILMDDEGILFTGYAPDTPPLLYADLTLNPDTDNSEAQE
jgi:surface glycoprotein (TIGR04207 family)